MPLSPEATRTVFISAYNPTSSAIKASFSILRQNKKAKTEESPEDVTL